ncbi:hypothetical protein MHU86_23876 [Fragilaria crotonensis]|nr:hypothetical protein MHU86_23876 [Fragilaria crotonensis]
MTSSSRKRKRHTPNEQEQANRCLQVRRSQLQQASGTTVHRYPSMQQKRATARWVMRKFKRRDSGARSSHLRNISRRCARRSATPPERCRRRNILLRGNVPRRRPMGLSQPVDGIQGSVRPGHAILSPGDERGGQGDVQESMKKEVTDQFNNGNFTIIPKSEVPKGQTILPAVWQMKKTRREGWIDQKYKARLNIDGSRMKRGEHYDETYAPVASWNSTLYMKVPAGMELEDDSNPNDFVLKIHRNIYGQKQAGRVWNQYLVRKLVKDLGFNNRRWTNAFSTEDQRFEGDLADFLGVSIDRRTDGTIHLSQPHLIDQILEDLRLNGTNVKSRSTPAASSKLLTRHSDSESFDNSFNYRSIIGKLNYLEKATRSDIAYAVHQCARFVSDPKKEHGDAVRWLGRYLLGTRDKGTIMQPMTNKDLEVFVDASFCGDWDPKEAASDRDTARSRHGYIIKYANCPLL